MRALVGKKAPSFSLPSDEGKKASLKDYLGKTVVLYFYPKDLTPGCTQESCEFGESHQQFKKLNAVILGVSRDSIEKHQKFKQKYDFPFLLLSDEYGKVCEKYGVWQEKSLYGKKFMGIVRSTFVIDSKGKVIEAFEKVKVNGHVEAILKLLKKKI